MKLKKVLIFACAVFMSAFGMTLFADEVRMKNGDRITGRIVTMEKKALTLFTPYAGEIAINWDQVETIKTTAPVHVVFQDQTSAHGILGTTKAGELQMETAQPIEPLLLFADQVESINPPSELPLKISGRVNGGLDVKKGNTDTEGYYIDGEAEARTENNRYSLAGEVNREEESGKKTVANWLLYMSYDHFLTNKWFLYTNADFEQDDFKNLNLRTTVGAGSGYQLFESDIKNLSLRGGLAYVNTDYNMGDQDNDYAAGQWTVKYDRYFFEKLFQFFHLHDGVISIEDAEDILIRTRTGFRIPFSKNFNTTLQYNWDWNNTPASGKDRVDERYLFTLGYSWK